MSRWTTGRWPGASKPQPGRPMGPTPRVGGSSCSGHPSYAPSWPSPRPAPWRSSSRSMGCPVPPMTTTVAEPAPIGPPTSSTIGPASSHPCSSPSSDSRPHRTSSSGGRSFRPCRTSCWRPAPWGSGRVSPAGRRTEVSTCSGRRPGFPTTGCSPATSWWAGPGETTGRCVDAPSPRSSSSTTGTRPPTRSAPDPARSSGAGRPFESIEEVLHHRTGLFVTDGHAQCLLLHQNLRDTGDEDHDHHRREQLRVDPLLPHDSGQDLGLPAAEQLPISGDFRTHRLAVIGQGGELHHQGGTGGVVAQGPERPERLIRADGLHLTFETLFGPTAEGSQDQVVHGTEVVVDELGLQTGSLGYAPGAHRRVPLLQHEPLGGVEERGAGLGAL